MFMEKNNTEKQKSSNQSFQHSGKLIYDSTTQDHCNVNFSEKLRCIWYDDSSTNQFVWNGNLNLMETK